MPVDKLWTVPLSIHNEESSLGSWRSGSQLSESHETIKMLTSHLPTLQQLDHDIRTFPKECLTKEDLEDPVSSKADFEVFTVCIE